MRGPQFVWIICLSLGVDTANGVLELSGSVVQACEGRVKSVGSDQPSLGLQLCPRRFTGWALLEHLETARYALALCQRDNVVYLVGHEKVEHETFIEARIVQRRGERLVANDNYGFTFEIESEELKVIRDGQIVSREELRRSLP